MRAIRYELAAEGMIFQRDLEADACRDWMFLVVCWVFSGTLGFVLEDRLFGGLSVYFFGNVPKVFQNVLRTKAKKQIVHIPKEMALELHPCKKDLKPQELRTM